MNASVKILDFETAALIRDEIYKLEGTGPKKAAKKRKPLSGS